MSIIALGVEDLKFISLHGGIRKSYSKYIAHPPPTCCALISPLAVKQSLCQSAICMMLDNWTKPRLTGVIMGSEFTLTTICIVTKCDKHIGYLPSADCFEQGQARVEVVCSYQVDIYCQQNSTLLKDLKNLNSHV